MTSFTEGQKVWVCKSNSGYEGPAIMVGLVFGSMWLVRAVTDIEQVLVAEAIHLKPMEEVERKEHLTKEEKKELKRKLKAERKNHVPRNGKRSRR